MPGEVAYAASKAALAGITLTLADQLGDAGITVNCVRPLASPSVELIA